MAEQDPVVDQAPEPGTVVQVQAGAVLDVRVGGTAYSWPTRRSWVTVGDDDLDTVLAALDGPKTRRVPAGDDTPAGQPSVGPEVLATEDAPEPPAAVVAEVGPEVLLAEDAPEPVESEPVEVGPEVLVADDAPEPPEQTVADVGPEVLPADEVTVPDPEPQPDPEPEVLDGGDAEDPPEQVATAPEPELLTETITED